MDTVDIALQRTDTRCMHLALTRMGNSTAMVVVRLQQFVTCGKLLKLSTELPHCKSAVLQFLPPGAPAVFGRSSLLHSYQQEFLPPLSGCILQVNSAPAFKCHHPGTSLQQAANIGPTDSLPRNSMGKVC